MIQCILLVILYLFDNARYKNQNERVDMSATEQIVNQSNPDLSYTRFHLTASYINRTHH
jgi:hypothetical protein